MSVKIFLSFSKAYSDIAKGLKQALLTLEGDVHLDIQFSVDMAGATDWRQWIEDQVRSADIFLLVYPHAAMPMEWSNYELGRFCDRDMPVVCLRNTDIDTPPPAFQPYQGYEASVSGITKFLNELFVSGTLTGGRILNADVGRPTSDFFGRARNVAEEVAALFAQARVREHFYERRVALSIAFDEMGGLDPRRTMLHGNPEGLHVLGLNAAAPTPWGTLRQVLGEDALWLRELESMLPRIPTGVLPPALTPFRAVSGIYIPVLVKAEIADGVLTKLIMIFVAASVEQLRPMLGWTFPRNMPEPLKALLHLVRQMFRARWEILEPRHQELRIGAVTPERAAQIASLVVADFDQMQRTAQADGASGADQFFAIFERDLRPELQACGEEWLRLLSELRSAEQPQVRALQETMGLLLANNRKWLELAGRQFLNAVNDLA